MANYPYKRPGTQLDDFRETIIEFQIAAEQDMRNLQSQVSKAVVEGDSSPQAAAAQIGIYGKTYGSLKERLDTEQKENIQAKDELNGTIEEIDQKKADKTELVNLDAKIARAASGSPKGTFATVAALQSAIPNGDNNIYVVTADGKWYYWNKTAWTAGGVYQSVLGENTITAGMIDFIRETSTNIFDKNRVFKGFTLNSTNGQLYESATNSVSDFMPVTPGEKYIGFPIARKAFYDSAQKFISTDTLQGEFIPPANAAYMRIVVAIDFLDFARVNKGAALKQYEEFYREAEQIKYNTRHLIGKHVKPEHIEFVQESTNLFNKNDLTHGFTLNPDGTLNPNNTLAVSGFVPVNSDTVYSLKDIARVNLYDINKINLSTHTGQPTLTTTSRAYYARFVAYTDKIETAQVNKGDILLPYENGLFSIKNLKIKAGNFEERTISLKHTDFIEMSSNLFNIDVYTLGYNLSNSDGSRQESIYHKLSNKIFVKPGEKLTGNVMLKYAFFTKDGNWITNSYPTEGPPAIATVTAPPNTFYAIGVYSSSEHTYNLQVNKGESLLPYEKFYTIVNGAKIIDNQTFLEIIQGQKYSKSAIVKRDKYVITGDINKTYSAPTIPDYLELVSSKTADIIALYDELVRKYPHYIKKTVLGKNSLGNDIFRYDFKPGKVDGAGTEPKIPKMILISGIHPEKAGVYSLYQSMKQICENWGNDESLEVLRWNIHFIVIPVVNIYGYDNNTRRNHNKVDLARNYGVRFSPGNPEDQTYGGTAPLSEMESQLIDGLLNANQDAIFFTSFHNFWTDANQHYFIWDAAATQLQVNIGKQLISKMSRKWKKEHNWMPQDETTFFGLSVLNAPAGSEGMYAAEKYGIQGGTFEVCADVMLKEGHKTYDSLALTLGLETFVNFLLLNLKHNVEFYNDKL